MSSKEKNVFISHYGKDDEHIGKLKDLLGKKGYTLKKAQLIAQNLMKRAIPSI